MAAESTSKTTPMTTFEEEVIQDIDKLLRRCELRTIAFQIQQAEIQKTTSRELVAERLRYFAIDLYSVLDYICFLFYCHFRNNGNRIDSSEARNAKFPFKSDLYSSSGEQETSFARKRNEFCEVQSNFLGLRGEIATQYEKLILRCQIIIKVEDDGTTPVEPQPQPTDDSQAFHGLHFLRNFSVHRNLVRPVVSEHGLLYYNKKKGSHEIVSNRMPERDNDPDNWERYQVDRAYWIEIPPVGNLKPFRPITIVAPNLLRFVVDLRNELLNLVFAEKVSDFDYKVTYGYEHGVRIGNVRYTKEQFEEKSLKEWDLWAV